MLLRLCIHQEKRTKKKIDEDVKRRVDEMFSKRGSSRNSSPRRENHSQGAYERKHDNSEQYGRYPHHDTQQQGYPDWHPMGHYGNRSSWNGYRQDHYDNSYSRGQYNGYRGYGNPYELGDWFPGYHTHYRRMEPRIFEVEKSVYRHPNDNGQHQRDGDRQDNSRPTTPNFNQPVALDTNAQRCLLTHDQARTKQLLARAHQVIQNGQNVGAIKPKAKKKKSKGKNKRLQPNLNANHGKKKVKNTSTHSENSKKKSKANSSGRVLQRPLSGKHSGTLRQGATLTRSSSNSGSRSTSQNSSLLSSSSGSISQLSSSIGQPRVVLENIGARKGTEPKKTSANPPVNRIVLEKCRDQLNKELGPARMKRTPQTNSFDTMKGPSPGENKLTPSTQGRNPGSTENIRAQFRKILDDIDQPVMSASEILRDAKRNDESSVGASETTLTASWAESSVVTSTDSELLNKTNTNLCKRPSQNVIEVRGPVSSSSLTQSSTSKGLRRLSQDRCAALQRSVSSDTERVNSTPTRSVISLSSDADTPTNKKRPNPQPNLNRARARITSKHKESPDVPMEIRQAKLKQLLQKYDRVKKTSPEAMNSSKKTPGPRFGIDLNLQSRPMETMDTGDLPQQAELVEILPEKRMRSLSESDSMLSFTTAATESTTNLSVTINQPDPNIRKVLEEPQQQQRTSTPTYPAQQNPLNLNAELLKMSEREETLHASVRSLSLQEANVQSEIDNRTAVLKALQEQLEKLNEKKLCVEALKRRHEGELERLRQDRLALLRGSVPGHQVTSRSSPSNIFQDVTKLNRRTSFGQTQPEIVINNVGTLHVATPQNGSTSPPVLPDFDLSKVKSEPNSGEDSSILFPTPGDENTSKPQNAPLKGTKCVDGLPLNETPSVSDSLNDGNSTEFYSVNNGNNDITNKSPSRALEVDHIIAKYSKQAASEERKNYDGNESPAFDQSHKRKQKTPTQRQSPRILRKERLLTANAPTSPVTQTVAYNIEETGNSPTIADDKRLPKSFKTHEMALVGMNLIKDGLVTCSLDETIALHTPDGKRHSLSLGASPTAMTTVSEDIISLVFIATQKVVSKTQMSDDAVVFNKMEHWLDIYVVRDAKNGAGKNIFQVHSRLKLKTRVLCMHYDKQTLFCGMRDGMAAIITLDSLYRPEEDVNILECHSHSAITCLTTGMEGARRILCCGSADCTVSVRDAIEGLLLRTIQGHTKTVTCLQLVHNVLYSASVDRLILCHNLNTGNLLHRFSCHVGVVRALRVVNNTMVTLCSDRNIRFFDTKTARLIEKPKALSSLPLFACAPSLKNGFSSGNDKVVYVGCEDSTVMRISFPQIQPIRSSPARNLILPTRSKQRSSSKSPKIIGVTGKFKCQWEGCTEVGTFATGEDLGNHVFSLHIDTSELTQIGDHTLKVGTCCQWESCTHYFAPELDTVRDITAHIQRHFDELKDSVQNGDKTTETDKRDGKSPSQLHRDESTLPKMLEKDQHGMPNGKNNADS